MTLDAFEQIKNKYGFRDDFNFQIWLKQFNIWAVGYKEYDDKNELVKKRREALNDRITAAIELKNLLNECDTVHDAILMESKKGVDHDAMKVILDDFIKCWQSNERSLPKKLGRPDKIYHEGCVNLLISMYKDGCHTAPQCNRNTYKVAQYYGDFYDFMIDMLPLLKSFGVNLDVKTTTLGDYASTFIRKRREEKDKPWPFNTYAFDDQIFTSGINS